MFFRAFLLILFIINIKLRYNFIQKIIQNTNGHLQKKSPSNFLTVFVAVKSFWLKFNVTVYIRLHTNYL